MFFVSVSRQSSPIVYSGGKVSARNDQPSLCWAYRSMTCDRKQSLRLKSVEWPSHRAATCTYTPKLLARNARCATLVAISRTRRARVTLASRFKVKHLRRRSHAIGHGQKLITSMDSRRARTNLPRERHLSTDLCTGFVDNLEL